MPEFDDILAANAHGGFAPAEAYAVHRATLASEADRYDARVARRIMGGKDVSAADYIDLVWRRKELIDSLNRRSAGFDAIVLPTVPVIAPSIAELEDDGAFMRTNALMLRNPSLMNFLDRCAISLPCHKPGDAPVGLMLSAAPMADRRLFLVSAAVEQVLSS